MELKAVSSSIDDVLRLRRKYVIPRFQREFSWENEEVSEIFYDLIDNIIYENGKLVPNDYFIGSLVLVGDDDDTTIIERYVVDGQQRLTTFTIAFAALAQKFKELGELKLSKMTHLNVMGEDNDGISYAKLVNESPKPFFQKRIQHENIDFSMKPNSAEEKRILAAYNFFDKQLKEGVLVKLIKENNHIHGEISYIDALKAFRDQILKCKVIYVTVKSFDDAYTIFEVLNSKGKDLSPVDVIKNSIFSILTEQEPLDSASEQWKLAKEEIKKCESIDFNTFYRHYWISKYRLSTNRNLVKNFKKNIEKNITDYTNFISDLAVAAKDYSKISSPNKLDWEQPENISVYTSLKALKIFNVTQVRIFLLALFDIKRRNLISHKNYLKTLNYLEHFHFIFTAVCSSRPSGLEQRYSSYARRLRNCNSKEESAKCIDDLINDLKNSLPEYNVFEEFFKNINYTSDQEKQKKLVQYILQKLETHFSTTEVKFNLFTIEHILSESSNKSCVGMIGNLLPLGSEINSNLQDKDFTYKIRKYRNSQYISVKNFVEEYGAVSDWNEELIYDRTVKIAKILYENIIEG